MQSSEAIDQLATALDAPKYTRVSGYRVTGGAVIKIDGRRHRISLKRYHQLREWLLYLEKGGGAFMKGSFNTSVLRPVRRSHFSVFGGPPPPFFRNWRYGHAEE